MPGYEGLDYVFECTYGHYPWDDWEKDALAAGVSRDLAGLGRAVIREAFQHGWDPWLRDHCGWNNVGMRLSEHPHGQMLMSLALSMPRTARRQC